jgi:O-acetyl-ADP-ribose deacetylase
VPGFSPNVGRSAGVQPEQARLTGGHLLPASHVIHTVGPARRGGGAGERELLDACYRSCLAIGQSEQFSRVAFPAIATGIYGFPNEIAARIARNAVTRHLAGHDFPEQVIFVCFDPITLQAYEAALAQ